MFLATMETENFTFRALGATIELAKEALIRGWKAHIKQCEAYHTDGYYPHESLPEDWYGINVYPMEMNECLRDDDVLGVK